MKSKSIILLFVSLGFGLIAAVGISQVMGKGGGETSQVKTVPVLVALEFIDSNKELTDKMVEVKEWPITLAPESAINSLEQITGMSTVRNIAKGTTICKEDIVEKSQQTNINIREGFRVIFVKVGADGIGNGLTKPGDRVDIIGTFTQGAPPNASITTSTFLKNIEVFSVNETTERRGNREATGGKPNSIIGIILNTKQAEKLALVQKVGDVTFMLRGQESVTSTEEEECDPLPAWLEPKKPGEEYADSGSSPIISPQPRPRTQPTKMVVYLAGERKEYIINNDGSVSGSAEDDNFTAPRRRSYEDLDMDSKPDDEQQEPVSDSQGGSSDGATESDEYRNKQQ